MAYGRSQLHPLTPESEPQQPIGTPTTERLDRTDVKATIQDYQSRDLQAIIWRDVREIIENKFERLSPLIDALSPEIMRHINALRLLGVNIDQGASIRREMREAEVINGRSRVSPASQGTKEDLLKDIKGLQHSCSGSSRSRRAFRHRISKDIKHVTI